jgi:uncharacterized phiE125 gp8 family phage protein
MTTLAAFTKHVAYSTVVTDAVLFPTSELKKQLNLPSTGTEDDTWLVHAASVARSIVERSVPGGIAVRLQTKQLTLNKFPTSDNSEIEIPFPKLNSVVSINYYDGNNSTASVASSDYRIIDPSNGNPARLFPNVNTAWPTAYTREDAVTIQYLCGSTCSSDIEPTVKHAVFLLATHWYENRGSLVIGTISKEMEFGVQSLLNANGYGFYG